MRIGSTADWHLGNDMDDDIAHSVRQIADIFEKNKVDIITLPGDLFDHRSTAAGRNLLRSLIQELCSVALVIGCYGNHESPNDLDIFRHLDVEHPIEIWDAPHVYDFGAAYKTRHFLHVMPWFTKATWQALHIGVAKDDGDKTVSQLAVQYIRNNILIYGSDPDTKHILMGHLAIAGAKAQNHQPLIGEGISLGISDLEESGLYAGIFGHIHLGQSLTKDERFLYPGSPAAMNYGESPEKYCIILDTDSGQTEWHRLSTIDRYTVETTYPIGIHMSVEDFNEMKRRAAGARVRVLLHVEEGDPIQHAKEELSDILTKAGALEVKIEHQVKPKGEVRAVEISKADSMEKKLEAYWKANDNRPSDETVSGMKNKLAELETKLR